tara:strand:+ start:313 stop:618 length:306 start_codon:yes stop_codon:yes gene_type:complete
MQTFNGEDERHTYKAEKASVGMVKTYFKSISSMLKILRTDIPDGDGEKMFLEFLGYTKDDVEYEEPLRRIFLKNGKTIRLWNIKETKKYLTLEYSVEKKSS